MRVDDWLTRARRLGIDRLDAHLLLGRHCSRPRSWLLAHGDHELEPTVAEAAFESLARRAEGVPLAYLLGEKEFHGLTFGVDAGVLVPRPETELLVEWALERLPEATPRKLIDLGTGSGVLAVTVAHHRPRCQVVASDASPEALQVAMANARRHGISLETRLGHWWRVTSEGERFDVAVCNPPYIADGDPHLPALRHEPRCALVAGGDGLAALREVVAEAGAHLVRRGWLLVEHGHDQGPAVRQLLARSGFGGIETRRDLAGHERCSGGWHPAACP